MNYKCMFPPGSCCTLTGPGCAWQATGAESVAVAVPSRAPQPAAAAGMSSMPAQRCFPRGSSSLLRAWLASPWSPRFKHRCLASAAYVQVLFLIYFFYLQGSKHQWQYLSPFILQRKQLAQSSNMSEAELSFYNHHLSLLSSFFYHFILTAT